jgi:hypothetical protein
MKDLFTNAATVSELNENEVGLVSGGDGTIVVETCTPDGVAPTYKED